MSGAGRLVLRRSVAVFSASVLALRAVELMAALFLGLVSRERD